MTRRTHSDDGTSLRDEAPLTQRYLERCRRGLESIRRDLENGRFALIEQVGHEMAGSGHSFGFPPISTHGRAIVDAARQRHLSSVREAVGQLEGYLDRVEHESRGSEEQRSKLP